ncbi:RING finger and WD repeat domain-containing protein 3 [Halocaridina rubra]|uniref:RING-type E3 ubiquitin transferase n=1 Tax=Halocaridina rubra TaxID=373956 RepID=A0AAN8X4C8_HALRR
MSDIEEVPVINLLEDSDATYMSDSEDTGPDALSLSHEQFSESETESEPNSPVIGVGRALEGPVSRQYSQATSQARNSEQNVLAEEGSNSHEGAAAPVPDIVASESSTMSVDMELAPHIEQEGAGADDSELLIPVEPSSSDENSMASEQMSTDIVQQGSDNVDRPEKRTLPLQEVTPIKKTDTKKAPESPESDDEGQICTVCFEAWSNSGSHRLVSLKCGHLFGNSCIERWLKGQGGKCPQCNAKASKRDIRVIYAKSLKVLDTTERDRAIQELEKERETRRNIELDFAHTKMKYDLKCQMVKNLQKELQNLKNASAGINFGLGTSLSQATSSHHSNRLILHSCLEIAKDGGCRVLAYNEWLHMLIVSMPSQVTMFPGSGVKKINTIDMKAERYVPIHGKQVRDITFNPAKNDLLLSVGMDKCVKLTNICNNTTVGSFTADFPLWGCCWNTDQANMFFVGTASGTVIVYDTRNTLGPVKFFQVPGAGPIVSMCYIPYCASANFCLGGLLVARLTLCSFLKVKDNADIEAYELPLEGPFSSVSFEKLTRHFMVSCRPCQKHPHARHIVCELHNACNAVTANVIHTFKGGTTQKMLSRSCLIAHPFKEGNVLACASDESTQSTFIWDVSSGLCLQQLKCSETVIDMVPVRCGQNAYLTLLTEKSVRFYKWIDML